MDGKAWKKFVAEPLIFDEIMEELFSLIDKEEREKVTQYSRCEACGGRITYDNLRY